MNIEVNIEEIIMGEFSGTISGQIDDLIINGGVSSSDSYTWDCTTTTDNAVDNNSNDIHIVTPYEFEFPVLSEEDIEAIKKILIMKPPLEVKERVTPKHRMIRED